MKPTNVPLPELSPWTDPYGQTWYWNDSAWVRFEEKTGKVREAPKNPGNQYVRINQDWALTRQSYIYRGAADTHPQVDANGFGPYPGDLYFNTILQKNLTFTGTKWTALGNDLNIDKITQFVWINYPQMEIGDELTPIDDYGNRLPTFLDTEDNGIIMYAGGLQLTRYINDNVPAEFDANFSNGKVTAVQQAIPAGNILIEILDISPRQNKLHAYTDAIYIQQGVYYIQGGNFSFDTTIEFNNPAVILNKVTVVSDSILYFSIFSVPQATIVTVINGNDRRSFGNVLQLPLVTNPQPIP